MNAKSDYKKGMLAVIVSMLIWGVLPVYWQALRPISSWVIILYRILLVFVYSLIFARTRYTFREIFAPLKDRRTRLTYFTAGAVVTVNWSIYIYAVNSNQIVQSSIGYYIEPLMICLVGIVFFKEKLTKFNLPAMLMALAAVILLLVHFGELPSIALLLAITFSAYTAIKKTARQPALVSLVFETMLFALPALGVIIYLEATGRGAISAAVSPGQYALLFACGLVTMTPLAMFAYGAQRCPMFHIGLSEYISPSISLVLSLVFLGESVDIVQIIGFATIWIGLVFFTYGEYKQLK